MYFSCCTIVYIESWYAHSGHLLVQGKTLEEGIEVESVALIVLQVKKRLKRNLGYRSFKREIDCINFFKISRQFFLNWHIFHDINVVFWWRIIAREQSKLSLKYRQQPHLLLVGVPIMACMGAFDQSHAAMHEDAVVEWFTAVCRVV